MDTCFKGATAQQARDCMDAYHRKLLIAAPQQSCGRFLAVIATIGDDTTYNKQINQVGLAKFPNGVSKSDMQIIAGSIVSGCSSNPNKDYLDVVNHAVATFSASRQ